MDTALLGAALVLCGVFGVAGAAKLGDLRGSRTAARGFGVPDRLAGMVGVVLPVVELMLAVALLPASTRWWAACGALALLVVFCAGITTAMARGRAPECRCFGQLHSSPVGWRTLARNGVLVALAALIVGAGQHDAGSGAFAWGSRLNTTGWVVLALGQALLTVAVAGGYALVQLLAGYGRVLVRLEKLEGRLRDAGFELDEPEDVPQLGLALGTEAPVFSLDSVGGGRIDLATLLELGRPLLLLFTSPTCGPCSVLMPRVAQWQREQGDALTVAVLSHGGEAAVRAEAAAHGLEHVLHDRDGAVSGAYEANGTPSAVLVAADGTIASWIAAGSDWIEMLVEQTLAGDEDEATLEIGTAVPALPVRLLEGQQIELTSLIRGETVVLFWNPGCGFCRAMRDDLRSWEHQRPSGSRALIVVSAGANDDILAEAFSSPVIFDPDWALATAFGAAGTPIGVLVDSEKRIASPFVAGGEAVLDLLAAGTLSVAG